MSDEVEYRPGSRCRRQMSPEPQQESIIDSDAYRCVYSPAQAREDVHDGAEDRAPHRRGGRVAGSDSRVDVHEQRGGLDAGETQRGSGPRGTTSTRTRTRSVTRSLDYAYEAGIDPDFEVVTDAEKYAIVLDVLDDIRTGRSTQRIRQRRVRVRSCVEATQLYRVDEAQRHLADDIDAFLGPADRVYDLADLPERIETIASDHLGGRSVSSVLDSLPMCAMSSPRNATHWERTGSKPAPGFLDRLIDLCDALETAFEAHENGERDLPDNAYKLPKYLFGGYASGARKGSRTIWILNSRTTSTRSFPTVLLPEISPQGTLRTSENWTSVTSSTSTACC